MSSSFIDCQHRTSYPTHPRDRADRQLQELPIRGVADRFSVRPSVLMGGGPRVLFAEGGGGFGVAGEPTNLDPAEPLRGVSVLHTCPPPSRSSKAGGCVPALRAWVGSVIELRSATLGDAENVLSFWKEAAEGTSITDDVAGVARLIGRDPDALILAESDGLLVGSLICGWDGWRASLYRLAVLPSHRRQGISRSLLEAAEQRFVALGARRGDAMVLVENTQAQAAWAAAGYNQENHWRRWVKPLGAGAEPGRALRP